MLSLDRKAIMEAVHQLPAEEQWEIAREILQSVGTSTTVVVPSPELRREPPAAPSPASGTAASLRGIVKTTQPLDEEQLLDESRMERYS